jgi:hypothetical protein
VRVWTTRECDERGGAGDASEPDQSSVVKAKARRPMILSVVRRARSFSHPSPDLTEAA